MPLDADVPDAACGELAWGEPSTLISAKVLPMQTGGLHECRAAGMAKLDQLLPCLSEWRHFTGHASTSHNELVLTTSTSAAEQ